VEGAAAEGPECPVCKKGRLRRVPGKSGFFWSCSRWKADQPCKATWDDADGKPAFSGPKGSAPCPVCKTGYLRRIGYKDKFFWGCSRYREGCKGSAEDVNGKPGVPPPVAPPLVMGQATAPVASPKAAAPARPPKPRTEPTSIAEPTGFGLFDGA